MEYVQPTNIAYRLAAKQAGGTSKGVYFVPHGYYSASAMKNLGKDKTDTGYYDNVHTHAALANVNAQAFVFGLTCGTSPLASSIRNSTDSFPKYVGSCKSYNSSLPL